jgi:leucyl aminopeptidase
MNPKTFDLYPTLKNINEDELDFSLFNAIAIPVLAQDEIKIIETKFIKTLIDFSAIDLNKEIKKWPDFTAKAGEIIEVAINVDNLTRIYLVGVGNENSDDLRKASAALGRKVKNTNTTLVSAIASDNNLVVVSSTALLLSCYQYSLKSDQKVKTPTFLILGNYLDQGEQAERLVSSTRNSSLSISVKSGKAIKDFGGLIAVGNSSPDPGPRLIEISYAPKGSNSWPHVVLVGKGITFDTGGVSLKRPYESMVGMKSDMAGAAAALAATIAMARIQSKVKVTTLLMAAENALSATSQRPSDVIEHFGGTTVEVLNTDAEGRLVLADGLAYANLQLDPDYLIDIATLTGSATLGLGRQYAAMYTRNKSLAKKLSEAGEKIGERVWHMPLVDDYSVALESDIADFNHLADKFDFSAGSITAALFLEKFAGNRNWVHLDIAGTGRSEVDAGENIKGGTGFGARLLVEWLGTF